MSASAFQMRNKGLPSLRSAEYLPLTFPCAGRGGAASYPLVTGKHEGLIPLSSCNASPNSGRG